MKLRNVLSAFRPSGALEARVEAAFGAARVAVHAAEVDSLRSTVSRLEGLLDTAGDPDQGIAGVASPSLYRTIRGGPADTGRRDFSDAERARILTLSHMQYALRGDAENIVDIHLDFLLGDGLRPTAKTAGVEKSEAEALQEQLDDLWCDMRNALEAEAVDYVLSWVIEGELILSADLSPIDGHLDLGYFDPLRVKQVIQDRRGRDLYLLVEEEGRPTRETRAWFVLDHLTPQIEILPYVASPNPDRFRYLIRELSVGDDVQSVVRQRGVHGLCFFWPWNRPKGATRGRGELTSVLDFIDAHDEMLWSAVDVQNLKRLFVLILSDPSIRDAEDARRKLKELRLEKPPKNPRVIAMNDKASLEFKQPSEAGATEHWLSQELGVSIMGAKGFPETWRGSTGDATTGGARGGEFLPLRRLRRKQRRVTDAWKRLLVVQLELMRRAGGAVGEEFEDAFDMVTLEVGGKDKQRGAEIVKGIAAAAVQVAAVGAAKPELLNAIFLQALEEGGFTIPEQFRGLPEGGLMDPQTQKMIAQLLSQKPNTDTGAQGKEDRAKSPKGNGAGNAGA